MSTNDELASQLRGLASLVEVEEPDRLDLLEQMRQTRGTIDSLTEYYDEVRNEIVVPMEHGEVVLITGVDGRKYRVSKVQGSDPVYHYDEIDKRLTDAQKAEITETKVIGAKLKAAVEAGRIRADVLPHLVHYRPKKPYPKFDPVE